MASHSEVTTEISAMLSAAEAQALTATQMVALIDRSIATAIAIGGTPLVSMSVGGDQYSIGLSQAQRLREYYSKLADQETGAGGYGFGKLQARLS